MLEEKLKNLRDEVPLLEKDLKEEIYKKSIIKKERFRKNNLIFLTCFVILIILVGLGSYQRISLSNSSNHSNFTNVINLTDSSSIKAYCVYSNENDVFSFTVENIDFDKLYLKSVDDKILKVNVNDENVVVSIHNGTYCIDFSNTEIQNCLIELFFKKDTLNSNCYDGINIEISFKIYTDISEGNKQVIVYGFPKSIVSEGK